MGPNDFSLPAFASVAASTVSSPPVVIDLDCPATDSHSSSNPSQLTPVPSAPPSTPTLSTKSSHTTTRPSTSNHAPSTNSSPSPTSSEHSAQVTAVADKTVAVVPIPTDSVVLPTETLHPIPSTSANTAPLNAPTVPTPPSTSAPVSFSASPSASPSASVSISTSPASAERPTLGLANRNVSGDGSLTNTNGGSGHRRQVALSHRSDNSRQLQMPFSRRDDRVLAVYTLIVVVVSVFVVRRSDDPSESSSPSREEANNFYLSLWLIVNTIFAVIRVTGCVVLHAMPSHRLRILRRTFSWLLRLLNAAILIWFLIGAIWLVRYGNDASYAMRSLMTVIVTIELVVVAISFLLAVIVFLFAVRPVMSGRHSLQGATKEQLSKLPVVSYSADNCSTHSCSICLCDFEPDETLRQLPCSSGMHTFHAACVDEWLMQKLSCPICRDDPLNPRTSPASSQTPPPPVNSPPPVAAHV